MVKDLNKRISRIEYNSLNLPQWISFGGANNPVNEYVYSADGKKLNVIHKSSIEKRTDYVGSIIYENSSLKRILVDGGYIENGVYHFYLQDHLGNNRVVAKSDGTVIQTSHYYPYGMSFAESTFADKQPYRYNGKELDTENGLNLYDYDARQMEVVSGRFTGVDPMAEKYYAISPYVYCANNPIKYIDPDGNDWRIRTQYNHETGKIEYHITVNAVLYSNSSQNDIDMATLATNITKQVNDVYNINKEEFVSKIDFNLKVVNFVDEIGERDHVVQIVDQNKLAKANTDNEVAAEASLNGLSIRLGTNLVGAITDGENTRSFPHELGHTGGLRDLPENMNDVDNLMMQAYYVNRLKGDFNKSIQLNHGQIKLIRDNYIHNRLHLYSPLRTRWYGKKYLTR